MEEDHRIDEQGEKEVHEHATDHDQQSLPGGFCTELPRLLRLFHLLGIKTLVDHACYLAVATEGQPAYTVLCVAVFRLEFEE